jgi:superfamily II DNA or RNA helicase
MVNIRIDNYIRVSGIPRELFEILRERLTYPNPEYENARKYGGGYVSKKIARTLRTWNYIDGELCLPRGIAMEFLSLLSHYKMPFNIVDTRPPNKVDSPEELLKMRSYQEDLLEHSSLYPGPGYIIASPPGTGKTACGLELARREGRKTLWITHTKDLAEQTSKAASDEAEVQILGLPRSEIGLIGDQKFSVGEFLTVAIVKSLYSKKREKQIAELKSEFGTLVIDEVHHSAARTWQEAIYLFMPVLTVGLTATSYRDDGLTQMLFDCVGPVVARSDKQKLIDEGVLIIPSYWVLNTNIRYSGATFQGIVSQLITDPRRNYILFETIKTIYDQDRNSVILFLSGRVEHVEIMTKMCYEAGMEPVKLIGELSKLERSLAYGRLTTKEPRVITATQKLLSEGFDHPPITHVIIGTPFRNPVALEQIVGRAQRIYPGKKDAHLIDPVDDNGMLLRQAEERRAIAEGLGMDVNTLASGRSPNVI